MTSNWALIVILGLIVIVGIGLRVYRIDELAYFLGDQGRDVTALARMIETGEPALTGPGSAFGQFQRAPAYYYLLLSGLAAAGGNPVGGQITILALDVATIVLMFVASRLIAGSAAGLAAAAMYATASAAIIPARGFFNPGVLPFLSLLTFVALTRLAQGEPRFLPIVVGCCVAAWQMHDQAVLLILWTIVIVIVYRPRITPRAAIASAIVALLLIAPFAWNEAQNNFVNVRAMVAYVSTAATNGARGNAPRWIVDRSSSTWQIAQGFLPLGDGAHWLVVAAALVSFVVLLLELRRMRARALELLALYCALPLFYLI